jgi:hypothetical protein
LSFRYLLEKLPPPGLDSPTVKWQKFWDAIWKERGNSENKKLRDLVEKYRNKRSGGKEYYLDHVNELARGMYNTLSANIHHYSAGDMDLSGLLLNEEERDILDFLMPEAGLNTDLDWDVERKRLLGLAEEPLVVVEEDGEENKGCYS